MPFSIISLRSSWPIGLADWGQAGIAFGLAGSLRCEHADLLRAIAPFIVAFSGGRLPKITSANNPFVAIGCASCSVVFHGGETPGRREQVLDTACPQ
jgi:hypothetical protein